MTFRHVLYFVFAIVVCGDALADRESADQAATMLGAQTWVAVVRVENSKITPVYAREVYATIFEFMDVLWFYTDGNGTQSLSKFQGRTSQDRLNLPALIADIHPGFGEVEILPTPPASLLGSRFAQLRNGCFVESLHAYWQVWMSEPKLLEARLLTYYARVGGRQVGHTGLLYETDRGTYFWDPQTRRAEAAKRVDGSEPALEVAKAIADPRVARRLIKARYLPVEIGSLGPHPDGPQMAASAAKAPASSS